MDIVTAVYAANKAKADIVKKEREVFVPAEEYLFQDTGYNMYASTIENSVAYERIYGLIKVHPQLKVIVEWDGERYYCIPQKQSEGLISIGNIGVVFPGDEEATSEPFLFEVNPSRVVVDTLDTSAKHIVGIYLEYDYLILNGADYKQHKVFVNLGGTLSVAPIE